MGPDDLDLFELHDAFTIMSALSLEANGFARRGEGWRLAQDDEIGIHGRLPISTMGGLKSRGHPVGATGVYQIVEVVQQLTGTAGSQPGCQCAPWHGAEHWRQRRDHRDAYSGELRAAKPLRKALKTYQLCVAAGQIGIESPKLLW